MAGSTIHGKFILPLSLPTWILKVRQTDEQDLWKTQEWNWLAENTTTEGIRD